MAETIRLWDVAAGKQTIALAGHSPCGVASFAFTGDGRAMISVGFYDNYQVKAWDVATGKNTATFDISGEDFTNARAVSPNGKSLALATKKDTIQLWEVKTVRTSEDSLAEPKAEK